MRHNFKATIFVLSKRHNGGLSFLPLHLGRWLVTPMPSQAAKFLKQVWTRPPASQQGVNGVLCFLGWPVQP